MLLSFLKCFKLVLFLKKGKRKGVFFVFSYAGILYVLLKILYFLAFSVSSEVGCGSNSEFCNKTSEELGNAGVYPFFSWSIMLLAIRTSQTCICGW